ncbi:hypothetical protein B1806_03940 [Metallibacterium scheffleri]|uniref:Transposase n=1 Tax=Metallibacterium scheffleri TaxID=993689 RepID=A0A4S3KS29_9GAMM|nr:hypothetical protein B1806_03940 [Metallibacterium scheffleri]
MFIKVTRSGPRRYVQLVEAYRDDDGHPRQRTVATLGRLDQMDTQLESVIAGLLRLSGRHPHNRNTGTWDDVQQPLFPDPPAKDFVVLAKRWVVERTHAWNERARRLMAHHDRSAWAPIAWVWLVEARILATRLVA